MLFERPSCDFRNPSMRRSENQHEPAFAFCENRRQTLTRAPLVGSAPDTRLKAPTSKKSGQFKKFRVQTQKIQGFLQHNSLEEPELLARVLCHHRRIPE